MNRLVRIRIFVFLLFSVCIPASSPAEDFQERPLWEFGLFNTVAALPHYRGADQYDVYALPLPYLIYRGEFFRVNREGIREVFFSSDRLETSISLSGNPPVDADNSAREGMPELDALFEAGPQLKWFFTDKTAPKRLFLSASVRGVMSLDLEDGLSAEYEGISGGLHLIYDDRKSFREAGIGFRLDAGIHLSDSEYSGYFYDVDAEYKRADREAFDADGGYGGFSFAASAWKRLTETLSFGVYTRWDNLCGAAFADSPLVKSRNNITAGCALTWRITVSDRSVSRSE